jgi:hypothetical protein
MASAPSVTALCVAAMCAGMLCLVPAAVPDGTATEDVAAAVVIAPVFQPRRAEDVKIARALRNLRWDADVRREFDTLAPAAAFPAIGWSALARTAPPLSAQALLRLVNRNSGSQILAQLVARQDGRVSVKQVLQQVCGVGIRRDVDRLVDGVLRRDAVGDSATVAKGGGELLLPVDEVPRVRALAALVHGLPSPALRALRTYAKR